MKRRSRIHYQIQALPLEGCAKDGNGLAINAGSFEALDASELRFEKAFDQFLNVALRSKTDDYQREKHPIECFIPETPGKLTTAKTFLRYLSPRKSLLSTERKIPRLLSIEWERQRA